MDSSSETGPAGRVSPEPTLTAYRQGTAGDVAITAPQFVFPSSLDSWTSSPPLDSQSRDNLRQASVALDTAYERITTLRNSINDMLNRIPRESAGTGSSTNTAPTQSRSALSHDTSIRPPHSALVLTNEQVVEELNLRAARLRTLIPSSARQRLEEFESSNGNNTRESVWDTFSQNDRPRLESLPVPPRPRTPPVPDPVQPRAADPVDSRAAQRRDFLSANREESSTMIGRRVAARLNTSDSQGTLSSRLTLSEIEQRLQAQTAQIARELESMTDRLAAQRSRRVELASSSLRGDTPAVAGARDARIRTPSQVRTDSRLAHNPPAGRRPLGPTRDITVVDNTAHIVLPQPISRTSSNGAPIDEFLSSDRRALSAALREHVVTYGQATNSYLDTPRNLANTPEVRGTLVNLLARDRDDHTLPVRHAELIRSGVDNNRRGDTSTRSNPSPPTGQGRRRRGWARLNADGDEIDSDEDDNVSPHTRRLRMRFAYGTNVDHSARSHTVTIEDILWRTSGSDSEADGLSPDSTESCPSPFQGSPPPPAVRRPHPLPTPAEDMLAYPAVKPPQRSQVVCVSKYASLAGR